jgi:hypothetical protein
MRFREPMTVADAWVAAWVALLLLFLWVSVPPMITLLTVLDDGRHHYC